METFQPGVAYRTVTPCGRDAGLRLSSAHSSSAKYRCEFLGTSRLASVLLPCALRRGCSVEFMASPFPRSATAKLYGWRISVRRMNGPATCPTEWANPRRSGPDRPSHRRAACPGGPSRSSVDPATWDANPSSRSWVHPSFRTCHCQQSPLMCDSYDVVYGPILSIHSCRRLLESVGGSRT
jgi:hypothetical protein